MKRSLFALLIVLLAAPAARAQEAPPGPSAKKAFGLSLLVPGLGHRYLQGGDWGGAATVYALTDAALWLGLVGTEVRRDQITSDYRTFAAAYANAEVAGKDRQFFLNLATFRSSDEYRDVQLRNRNWNEIDYVAERTNQWKWQTDSDFEQFRVMREDAESLRRRTTFLVGTLVANRLVSAFSTLRAANRRADAPAATLSFAPPGPTEYAPLVNLNVRF